MMMLIFSTDRREPRQHEPRRRGLQYFPAGIKPLKLFKYNLDPHCDGAANTPNARPRGNAAKGDNHSQSPIVWSVCSGATTPRCMRLTDPSASTTFRSRVRPATACRTITARAAPACSALTAPTAHTAFVRGAYMVMSFLDPVVAPSRTRRGSPLRAGDDGDCRAGLDFAQN